jgi:hypothetical protein
MVAMEMADEHPANIRGIDSRASHGQQRGGAAIDQQTVLSALQMKAGLETSTAAKRVTAAQELELYRVHR